MGLGDEGVAFAFLGSDGEQADARGRYAKHDAAVVRTENGIVHEMFRLGVRIGAGIDENEMAVFTGNDSGEGRAVHAFHGAQLERGAGYKAAGVAATDDNA